MITYLANNNDEHKKLISSIRDFIKDEIQNDMI